MIFLVYVYTYFIKSNSIASSYSNRSRRRKIGYNSEASNHTGSFYLRVGVIGFGIGSMLHSGLIFGHYFEINHIGHPCSDILQAIKPVAHLCFTFIQMYFVFMNSKVRYDLQIYRLFQMCVHKYKTLARFGLIHMSGTNICVWLRSIVVETLHVIEMEERKKREMTVMSQVMNSTALTLQNTTVRSPALTTFHDGSLPELDCHFDAMMGKIVEKSSVYLYPCTIEYSLVCACVLYVMWTNVGDVVSGKRLQSIETASDDGLSRDSTEDEEEKTNIMSVDCAGSSRGLFLGIFLFVICVICLICYYVLASSEEHRTAAIVLSHISEDIIYVLALAATSVAAFHMRQMHFSFAREARIEEILITYFVDLRDFFYSAGLLIYGMFSIVASLFYLDTLEGGLTILTNLLMMIQSSTQATFTLAALRASASHRSQIEDKPGKQYVTFLLIANFALWAINTFETQRMEHNVVQVQFYGSTAWAIFSHISVPLGIYFRFHSTVSLSNVWKKAWKHKHAQHHNLHKGPH
ncbi:unnamed protein product [Lymnaea stagnalis]|uniref:Otopetrin-2 n=1 Tax=Lymnaea stagnalis TaxID=6523 RepID=A0AAV2HYQ0_LYMST